MLGAGTNRLYGYYLINPATGANNVVASLTNSSSAGFLSVSYTGATQSGQPVENNTGTTAAAQTLAVSVVDQGTGAWIIGCFMAWDGTGANYAAGSNTTQRVANDGFPRFRAHDSNTATTISQTYNWDTGNDSASMIVAEIAAVATTVIKDIIRSCGVIPRKR